MPGSISSEEQILLQVMAGTARRHHLVSGMDPRMAREVNREMQALSHAGRSAGAEAHRGRPGCR